MLHFDMNFDKRCTSVVSALFAVLWVMVYALLTLRCISLRYLFHDFITVQTYIVVTLNVKK